MTDVPADEVEQGAADDRRSWTRSRRVRLLVGAVVVVLLLGGAGAAILARLSALPDDAAFRLGGRTYSESDLLRFLKKQQALYGADVPDLSEDGARRRAAAHSYAVSVVVDLAVRDAGLTVSGPEVESAESDFITRTYPSGRDAFVEALAAEGLKRSDVVAELRRQLLVAALYDRVTSTVELTPAEVEEAFESDPASFAQPESRLVSEIVLPTCEAARGIAPRLGDATTFARVAREQSLDSTTSAKGGSLGFVARAQLQPAFGTAAFAAQVGQVFGPVPADSGSYCYLGIVRSVRPARTPTFDEVRVALTAELTATRGLEVWKAFLEKKIRAADVEYADRFRPGDPDSVPAATRPSPAPSPSPSPSP